MNLSALWQRLLDTLQHPAADPRATIFLIATALVLFLVVVLVIFIFLPDEEQEEVDEWGLPVAAAAPPKRSNLLLITSLLIVVLLVAAFGYGDWRSRQDRTCLSCHVLQPSVETWKASTHSKVSCIACHKSPGVLGGAETRVRAASDLIHNLAQPVSLNAPATVNQGNCISCHEKQLSQVITVGRLRIQHQGFINTVPCAQCHGQVGHDPKGTKSAALSPYGVMTTCTDCHDGKIASRDCSTCHVGDIAYSGAGPNEFARIDLSPPTNCKGCHSLDSCTACHGIVMPHPPGWGDPKMHAPAGAFDTAVCVRCHDAACGPCHGGIHTAHGPNWKTQHQTAGPGTTCTVPGCHDINVVGADWCRLCHPSSTK
jgi:hypothetical protein